MKKTIISAALLAFTLSTLSTGAAAAVEKTATVKVPTLVCGMCVKNITKAASALEGVKSVKVDKKAKTATVVFDDSKTSLPKIEAAIASAGYDANTAKRNVAAYSKLDACCKVDSPKP